MAPEDCSASFQTQSLCPECLARIPATRFVLGNDIYMKKTCPDHGEFQVVLWRGDPSYQSWVRPKVPCFPDNPATGVDRGCPFDCGLCPEHRQQTCTALLEVTQRCNLNCAFCFADADTPHRPDPDLTTIRRWYESILASGTCNIQLSGGEPTLRNDLPDIVALGRSLGFGFIQINTNGLRLGTDPAYVERLKNAGLASVFLQFDGTHEDIHRKLRGGMFLKQKLAAIENCRNQGLGVVLVPTVVPRVNDRDLGTIVEFALKNLDVVRGVHFQPVSYFGRYPHAPSDVDRITIPEIIRNLEDQTGGLVTSDAFRPPGCENPLCSFHGNFVLMPDNSLKSLTARDPCGCHDSGKQPDEAAAKTKRFVAQNWSLGESKTPPNVQRTFSMGEWGVLLERASTHKLCISGMAFQDVWNIDLDRLRDCCIHVVGRDGRLIPFCAYNLTSSAGRSLFGRGQ
jgi:tetraether lipid synthase